jgi:hypothetical protein
MSVIQKITTHEEDALDRFPEQYREQPNLAALASIAGTRAQTIEDLLYEIQSTGSIADSYSAFLDQIGEIVGVARGGFDDVSYRLRIIAKIGQNVSEGTGENLIAIFKTLMRASKVYFTPLYPAGAYMTAVGADPLGSIDDVKKAMDFSHTGGVSLEYFISAAAAAFSFLDDPDPSGLGFGDSTDGSVGGSFASIL